MGDSKARQKIILSIDTSVDEEAVKFAKLAQVAGAKYIKLGLELSSATSWRYCAELAAAHNLQWVADVKLHDIPNTVKAAVRNLKSFGHPPFGITIHTASGTEAMRLAQTEAGDIKMLGVTVLTSIAEQEGEEIFHVPIAQKVMELAYAAAEAGIAGIVASPLEVGAIKKDPKTKNLFAMIPGTRPTGAHRDDQVRVTTPAVAIKNGADLLVIGRQITQAKDPLGAYNDLITEIERA
jgi:orotidine-5'-phosphate decarboxylase